MRFKAGKAVIFALGAAVGAAASGLYFKRRYEAIAREDNEARRKRAKEKSEAKPTKDTATYSDIVEENGYETKGDDTMDRPRVISPDEFGENEEYDTVSLTYYADDVLTNDIDEPMTKSQIKETVGFKALRSFGEYEDDSVFVRNDPKQCYYEILRDSRKYGE